MQPRHPGKFKKDINNALGIPFATGYQHFPSSVSPKSWSSRKLTQAHQASETGLIGFNYRRIPKETSPLEHNGSKKVTLVFSLLV